MKTSVLRATGLVCLLAGSPFLAGCGVIFGGTRQSIRATSSPEGAVIRTAPQTVEYKTPTTLNLERKQEYVLTFAAPGYSEQKVELQRSIRGGILVLDILSGVVGVVIDAATGGWYKLSPDVTNVSLTKLNAATPGPDVITVGLNKDGNALTVVSSEPSVVVNVNAQ